MIDRDGASPQGAANAAAVVVYDSFCVRPNICAEAAVSYLVDFLLALRLPGFINSLTQCLIACHFPTFSMC